MIGSLYLIYYTGNAEISFVGDGVWLHIPLIPALGRQRQADLSDIETSLVYRASSRTTKGIQREFV